MGLSVLLCVCECVCSKLCHTWRMRSICLLWVRLLKCTQHTHSYTHSNNNCSLAQGRPSGSKGERKGEWEGRSPHLCAAVVSALISLNMQITCTTNNTRSARPRPPSRSAHPQADSGSMVCTSVQAVVVALARDVGALGICLAGCHYDKIVRWST